MRSTTATMVDDASTSSAEVLAKPTVTKTPAPLLVDKNFKIELALVQSLTCEGIQQAGSGHLVLPTRQESRLHCGVCSAETASASTGEFANVVFETCAATFEGSVSEKFSEHQN